MCDVYVYYFVHIGPVGERLLSKRRATLERIKVEGEPVMESQFVVDHSEVDDNGFVIGHASANSHPMDELWSQIRSLDRRAQSRDNDALQLDERSEAAAKYMLSLESKELRKQAQALRTERVDKMANELGDRARPYLFR